MVKISDPRHSKTTTLPSYPGSEVVMYTTLRPKDQRAVQKRYNGLLSMLIKNGNLQGKTAEDMKDMSEAKDLLGDIDISEMNEMNAYQLFLHIKSRNIEDEDGEIQVTFESFEKWLQQEDLDMLATLIKKEEKTDEKKTDS